MRVLVLGGAGYIGSHTARVLSSFRHEPILYDNLCTGYSQFAGDFPLINADIRNQNDLLREMRGHDAVFHFAAHAYVGESIAEPKKYFENNVEGSLSVINAAVAAGIRYLIFSSTCATYGIPPEIPITDSSPQNPISPYGLSKLFVERALQFYDRAYGLRSVSLRYFNAAGADDSGISGEIHRKEARLIPAAFEAATGVRPSLSIFGDDYPTADGTCVRDYIHVCDLAEAHVRALEYLVSGGETTAFNVGTGRGYSVREVLAMVETVTGCPVSTTVEDRRPGDPAVLVAEVDRTQRVLKWKADRSLRDMVTSGWEWFRRKAQYLITQKQCAVSNCFRA